MMQTLRTSLGARLAAAVLLVMVPACGSGDFLGLEDYQRDLLAGGLLAAALLNQGGAPDGDGVGAPLPGADGVSCWDLDGNGTADPNEDVNGDGDFTALDCQGPAGSAGTQGTDGAPGVSCWDLDGNGAGEPTEDVNGDGMFDALDCQGAEGPPGADGATGDRGDPGPPGADGVSLFHIFVDDFFAAEYTPELPIALAYVDEPILGVATASTSGDVVDAVAYRVAIPEIYDVGNDVTMRIQFHRTGPLGGCFVFRLDARRLRHGLGVEVYGGPRWIRVLVPATRVAGEEPVDGLFVTLDLPVNTSPGLEFPNDLQKADFLAFELTTSQVDGGAYQILGVEFFESRVGTAALRGATVFDSEDVDCGFEDCNENGRPDALDIADGTSEDCNEDGIPDECAACPPLDLVFLMDTSGSMRDEGLALCNSINGIVADLAGRGITLNPEILAIAPNALEDLPPCVAGLGQTVEARFDDQVPGDNGACPATLTANQNTKKDENWASATSIVAQHYPWSEGAIRVIVPVSDEGACLGDSCEDPGQDRDAVENAIVVATANDVIVSPIAAGGSSGCVIGLARDLASGTGGISFQSSNAGDLADAITDMVERVCRLSSDCNENGIPDECDLRDGTSYDCNENGVPDECEAEAKTLAPITFEFDTTPYTSWDDYDSDDDDYLDGVLPFAVQLGDETFTDFEQDSNGYVELLHSGDSSYGYGYGDVADLIDSGTPQHTFLMAAYDDLSSYYYGQYGYRAESDRITFYWNTETYCDEDDDYISEFQIILYSDGRVQWNFGLSDYSCWSNDLFSGLYLGHARQELYTIRRDSIPENESWLFTETDGYADCNSNGVPDACDIRDGTSEDCQPNGIPDECDGGCGG